MAHLFPFSVALILSSPSLAAVYVELGFLSVLHLVDKVGLNEGP